MYANARNKSFPEFKEYPVHLLVLNFFRCRIDFGNFFELRSRSTQRSPSPKEQEQYAGCYDQSNSHGQNRPFGYFDNLQGRQQPRFNVVCVFLVDLSILEGKNKCKIQDVAGRLSPERFRFLTSSTQNTGHTKCVTLLKYSTPVKLCISMLICNRL